MATYAETPNCAISYIQEIFYASKLTSLLILASPPFPRYIETMEIMGVSAQADVPSFIFIVNDIPRL